MSLDSAGRTPARTSSRVVLPAPFGPMIPRISPAWMSKATSVRTACSAYCLLIEFHPKQNLIVCLSGGARSFHRERCIASDWGAWRDQLENSVHAQFPRHNEYCAELGRRPSDGVSALPRPKGYSLIYSTTRTETHHETRSQSPRSFGGTADFMRIRVEDKPFALRPPTGDIGPQEFTLTRGVHHRIRSTDKNA